MCTQKTWTYDEITKATEDEITRLVQQANSSMVPETFFDYAHGALLAWNNLTAGCKRDGDFDRLERLISAR